MGSPGTIVLPIFRTVKVDIHTIKPVKIAKSTRRRFTSSFKTKVFLEVLKERHSIEVLAKKFDIQPNQISAWNREFIERTEIVFEKLSSDHGKADQQKLIETLYARIGELTVANDFLKKKTDAVPFQPPFPNRPKSPNSEHQCPM
jgi:transposase